MLPLIKKVFREGSTQIPDDTILRGKATQFFQNHKVRVAAVGCHEHCYAQFDHNSNFLLLNEGWATRAIGVHSVIPENHRESYDLPDNHEWNIHIVEMVETILHELMHSLTPQILIFEAEEKNKSIAEPTLKIKPFTITPTKIGSRFKDARGVIGDMGNGFQELLLGNDLRMKFSFSIVTWQPHRLLFDKCEIVAAGAEVVNHVVEFSSVADERAYLCLIRQSFRNILGNVTDPAAAVALYNSFAVNTEILLSKKRGQRKAPDDFTARRNAIAISLDSLYADETEYYDQDFEAQEVVLLSLGKHRRD